MRQLVPFALVLCFHAEACRDSSAQTPSQAPQQSGDYTARFVSHVEHIQPGGVAMPKGMVLRNPYEGNAAVAANGAKLFVSYNCIDCHGADGSGAMGPSLADGRWHFGGTSPEVF